MRPRAWEKFLLFLNKNLFSSLAGITAGDWLRVLWDNAFDVDFRYWPRAAVITLGTLSNSIGRRLEEWRYGQAVAAAAVRPPLFILGHWRNGTTHLHYLLAVDPRFAYPNNYQVCFPHTFLTTEARNARFVGFWIPEHRPQDNVRMEVHTPQEDEFALCTGTLLSPYTGWFFHRREWYYDRYLTLRGVPEEEVARWKAALVLFLKKLTWKYGRPLLLKSPPHTCRIRLLLELFPEARFVHIHRNPYAVFQSTRGIYQQVLGAWGLQSPNWRRLEESILRRHRLMYEAFFEERGLIPKGQFHEVGFEELERDPVGQIRALYEGLNLPGFDAVRPALEDYVRSLAGYRKNEHAGLAPALRRRIAAAWERNFAEWGYAP
jgi:hypothetical protein